MHQSTYFRYFNPLTRVPLLLPVDSNFGGQTSNEREAIEKRAGVIVQRGRTETA